MSRADAFSAFYRESRSRLLLQVYAYCGDPEVAQRALADAYVSAGHHWRKIANRQDKDGWLREVAFRASRRSLNRARTPWYVRALHTADEHRPLLAALQSLPVQRSATARAAPPGPARPPRGRTGDGDHRRRRTTLAGQHDAHSGRPRLSKSPMTRSGLRFATCGATSPTSRWSAHHGCDVRATADVARTWAWSPSARWRSSSVPGALTAAQPENVAARGPGATGPTRSGPAALPAPADQIDAAVLAPLSTVQQMKFSNPWKMRGDLDRLRDRGLLRRMPPDGPRRQEGGALLRQDLHLGGRRAAGGRHRGAGGVDLHPGCRQHLRTAGQLLLGLPCRQPRDQRLQHGAGCRRRVGAHHLEVRRQTWRSHPAHLDQPVRGGDDRLGGRHSQRPPGLAPRAGPARCVVGAVVVLDEHGRLLPTAVHDRASSTLRASTRRGASSPRSTSPSSKA